MTGQTLLRSPSSNRRQPLLINQSPTRSMKFAEMAGGTTADCAAICCCCPCGLMNLIVLAVYKLPAGLWRRALKKKRKQRSKNDTIFPEQYGYTCEHDKTVMHIHPMYDVDTSEESTASSEKEILDLEKKMWERFYGTGFWRSPSQREQ